MGLTRKRHYDRYTLEFKKTIVKLANHPEVMSKNVAETLGLHSIIVYRWQMEYRRGELKGNPYMMKKVEQSKARGPRKKSEKEKEMELQLRQAEKRIKKLERELAYREDEVDLLKKAERFCAKTK